MMRLQHFKRRVAGAVVGEENAETETAARDSAMLATLAPPVAAAAAARSSVRGSSGVGGGRRGVASVAGSIGSEYDENDVESFMRNLEDDARAAALAL